MEEEWKLTLEADVHAMWVDALNQDYKLLNSTEQEEVRIVWINRLIRQRFDQWRKHQVERKEAYHKKAQEYAMQMKK